MRRRRYPGTLSCGPKNAANGKERKAISRHTRSGLGERWCVMVVRRPKSRRRWACVCVKERRGGLFFPHSPPSCSARRSTLHSATHASRRHHVCDPVHTGTQVVAQSSPLRCSKEKSSFLLSLFSFLSFRLVLNVDSASRHRNSPQTAPWPSSGQRKLHTTHTSTRLRTPYHRPTHTDTQRRRWSPRSRVHRCAQLTHPRAPTSVVLLWPLHPYSTPAPVDGACAAAARTFSMCRLRASPESTSA